MSLHAIVAALGGDLYHGGWRANVPAPGHSANDRSVSLCLSENRVLIHGFGAADWREARAHLLALGLIDAQCRPTKTGIVCWPSAARPDRKVRLAAARRIWDEASDLTPGSLSYKHLLSRSLRVAPDVASDLRHHPAAPVSVFRDGSPVRPALVARISDATGGFAGVEVVYLEPNGQRADHLRVPRKTIGGRPSGSAIRLMAPTERFLVGEGVMTVLSACEHFNRPGWALMSASNLATWSAPEGVRDVLIAVDRGLAGESAAERLATRLMAQGLAVERNLPPALHEDWNAAVAAWRREEGR